MAAVTPFQIISSSVGQSVIIVSGTIDATIVGSVSAENSYWPCLILTNFGGNKAWIRLSGTAGESTTATDHVMLPNTVQLFSNPAPTGVCYVGLRVSVTTSPNTLYVTPGQGSL